MEAFGFVCPHCGDYAFYYNHFPLSDDEIISLQYLIKVKYYKDYNPKICDTIRCQKCNKPIAKDYLSEYKERFERIHLDEAEVISGNNKAEKSKG